MRARSCIAAAVALALSACVVNPDPRDPNDLQAAMKRGFGGWIVIEPRSGPTIAGELLAIEGYVLYVLDARNNTVHVSLHQVKGAELWAYEHDWGFGVWGLLGTLSTISHGFFLALSAPVWILSAGLAAADESRHVRVRYPEDQIEELQKWARFPQGMPRRAAAPKPREQAWALTKQAQGAARAGECERVKQLDERVRVLDLEFHQAVFVADVAIQRCLSAPAPEPEPEPEPEPAAPAPPPP